ncbi:MAG: YceD family protein [Cyanobium sp.]
MAQPLRPIPLSELRALAVGKRWIVGQHLSGLETLTPVQGSVHALHHGTALEVSGEGDTIVTLVCDRCLQLFNQALRARVHELVEFRGQDRGPSGDPAEINLELARAGVPEGDDLDDRLDPAGSFDPERWLFEQLSLRLPVVNRCGSDCPGPATWSSEPSGVDPRWAALAGLELGERPADATGRFDSHRDTAEQSAPSAEPTPSGPSATTAGEPPQEVES